MTIFQITILLSFWIYTMHFELLFQFKNLQIPLFCNWQPKTLLSGQLLPIQVMRTGNPTIRKIHVNAQKIWNVAPPDWSSLFNLLVGSLYGSDMQCIANLSSAFWVPSESTQQSLPIGGVWDLKFYHDHDERSSHQWRLWITQSVQFFSCPFLMLLFTTVH